MKIYWCVVLFVGSVSGVMLTHDCPYDEIYKSCMFFEETKCWRDADQKVRVKTPAKRLKHCWGGCVCNHNSVRAFTNGPCVNAHNCMDVYFKAVLAKLPTDFIYF